MTNSNWLRVVDFTVSFGTIGYGIYSGITWVIVGGVLGLIFAFLNPAKWVKSWIHKRFVRQGSPVASPVLPENESLEHEQPVVNAHPLVYRPQTILDMNGFAHHYGNPYRFPIWYY